MNHLKNFNELWSHTHKPSDIKQYQKVSSNDHLSEYGNKTKEGIRVPFSEEEINSILNFGYSESTFGNLIQNKNQKLLHKMSPSILKIAHDGEDIDLEKYSDDLYYIHNYTHGFYKCSKFNGILEFLGDLESIKSS